MSYDDDDIDVGFDVDEAQREAERTFLPEGKYRVKVHNVKIGESKNSGSKYLRITLREVETGLLVDDIMNIFHEKEDVRAIAKKQYARLAVACGMPGESKANKLVGEDCMAFLVIDERDGYEPRNKVKKYEAIEGVSLPQKSTPAPSAAKPSSPAPAKKPGLPRID